MGLLKDIHKMGNLDREEQLWSLIKYKRDATLIELREWCKELIKLKDKNGKSRR